MNWAAVLANLEEMKRCNPGTHWEDINEEKFRDDTFYFHRRYHGLRSNKERIKYWYFCRNWLVLAWRQKHNIEARLEDYKRELEVLRRTPGAPPERIRNTELNIRRAETRLHEADVTYHEIKDQLKAYWHEHNYPYKGKPFFDSTIGKLVSGGVAVGSLGAGAGIFTNGLVTANATEAEAVKNGTASLNGKIRIKRDRMPREVDIDLERAQ